uniref:Uncharacterized protein n=1 Tax=Anguilla anguilla TaxID=7936 RepID=A0A0E9T4L7_ANGAN
MTPNRRSSRPTNNIRNSHMIPTSNQLPL